MPINQVIVIGGGAAGIFAALAAKRPDTQVIVLERSSQLLGKVKISGGGRCNVTTSIQDPKELIKNYPRGHREMLGPFMRFGPKDTVAWFEARGVKLKVERDGRMFPETNQSQTIINCLLDEAKKLGVEIRTQAVIESISRSGDGFAIKLSDSTLHADKLILATGSHPLGHNLAKSLGHTVTPLVPSLFTFNCPESVLLDLPGIVVPDAQITVGPFTQRGPVLTTHWGFSGPATLKLSAWAAKYLAERGYEAEVSINWIPDIKQPIDLKSFQLPKKLFKRLLDLAQITDTRQISKAKKAMLDKLLTSHTFQIRGKTTNKEEFVTCGGVSLADIDFKTMQSKLCPHLYFAGEILDIDAVTGGFNFQNAWTTGFIAGSST